MPDTPFPVYVGWDALTMWYARINHSNIRTNFGLLRYILVTPQSHRIHHSIEKKHQDKNFAVTFSIWDFIFGTQHLEFDEYPDTGVEDDRFPIERKNGVFAIIGTWFRQLIYPFVALIRGR